MSGLNEALAPVKDRLVSEYRKKKLLLMREEKKLLEKPTIEFRLEVKEESGYLRGLLRAIDFVEMRMNENEFVFDMETP